MPLDLAAAAAAGGAGGAGGMISPPVDSSLQGYTGGGGPNPVNPMEASGGGRDSSLQGSLSSGMGLVQMAVGLNQLRKAKRLPFPSYKGAMAPYAGMKSMYQDQASQGLGSEQMGLMRNRMNTQQSQLLRRTQESSPQASMLFGRTAAMDRVSGEAALSKQNIDYKQSMVGGLERMNTAMSNILQKDISAQRDYRITAERAAGAAIKAGSENIARGITGSDK